MHPGILLEFSKHWVSSPSPPLPLPPPITGEEQNAENNMERRGKKKSYQKLLAENENKDLNYKQGE